MENGNRTFRISYFMSSTAVTYILLSIATINYRNRAEQIAFLFFSSMALISLFSSIICIRLMYDVFGYSKTLGKRPVELKKINVSDSTIMINEIIVPVTFVALVMNRSVFVTVAMILLYQFCQYRVFIGNGFMMNLTFELVGLKVYQVKKTEKDNEQMEYVFTKQGWLEPGQSGDALPLSDPSTATVGIILPPSKAQH
ncbi:hypothetical protein [Limosilactobacillus reuteri]|uniref:hypothetical protein n=2 Tax=Limosilactobacillus reuteri TaxID=1598 RepID=UPI001E498F9E|nr:hypothetical protein [Limosilactobacillus reuteri]